MQTLITIFALVFLLGFASCAHAEPITEENAIKAIIGEAENQGWIGMRAVACAIRNRGSLKGVYGLHAPRVEKGLYSRETYLMARRQWRAIPYDITHGATGWGNASDIAEFKKHSWWKNCVITFRYRDHVFYREVKRG